MNLMLLLSCQLLLRCQLLLSLGLLLLSGQLSLLSSLLSGGNLNCLLIAQSHPWDEKRLLYIHFI